MRVIAGKARSLPLKTIKEMSTRPTQDRTKETLFNVINPDLYDAVFLDLFSGSGAIGIEALSRGAKKAYFIENNRKAFECIKENLIFTKLMDDAVLMNCDYKDALCRLDKEKVRFDIVFMDPPYNNGFEKDVLIFLSKSDLIDRSSRIIVEASHETDFDYLGELGFEMYKVKEYKTNKHVFIRMED